MTSYQRRLRNIEYYKQRGRDLEGYIQELLEDRKTRGTRPIVPMMMKGIEGDQVVTDVSSGIFTDEMAFKVGKI